MSVDNKPETKVAFTWFLRVCVIIGLGLCLANAWLDMPYSEILFYLSLVLLIPAIIFLYQLLNFPLEYTLLGTASQEKVPDSESLLFETPRFNFKDRQRVGAGILSVAKVPLSHWSSIGLKLSLYKTGISLKASFREVFVPFSLISKVERLSSIPRAFVIYHESKQLRNPIVFTDEKFFELASQTFQERKSSLNDGTEKFFKSMNTGESE